MLQPSQQLSQIEKSVTHLLIATKQLLETLTQWSRHQATEGEVSDVYVRLGYEFNIACRAFTSIGVDISDLGNVPDLLRAILEDTLSQDPSPASLDRYLPRIRDIIINLLHGLKRKQQKLRAKQTKDGSIGGTRQTSTISNNSGGGDSANGALYDEIQNRASGVFSSDQYAGEESDAFGKSYMSTADSNIPQRTSSVPVASGPRTYSDVPELPQVGGSLRDSKRGPGLSTSEANFSTGSIQNDTTRPLEEVRRQPSYIDQHPPPQAPPPPHPDKIIPKDFPAPPPVPVAQPRAQDALAALQRGGELERRASRRYSAYQIQKHLGQSPSTMPMIPPAQHGPIPNRGKEQRDSLNAVRSRSSLVRQRSSRFADSSPSRSETSAKAPGNDQNTLLEPSQQELKREGSPLARQAESAQPASPMKAAMRATLTGPLDLSNADYLPAATQQDLTPIETPVTKDADSLVSSTTIDTQQQDQPFVPEDSPEPGTALTLFLQYKSKIKKYVLSDGANDLSIARLQLAFIEKFSWHTHNNGVDLPEIYVQDPISGVRHELEDLSDIKDRTVLVLNVEAVDEVKRHFDTQLGGIRQAIDSMRSIVETQQSSIQQVSTRQEDAAKEMARISSAPSAPTKTVAGGRIQVNGSRPSAAGRVAEVATLRRDLAVMRQTLSSFTSGITSTVDAIRDKAATVKAKAADMSMPSSEEAGRAYVNIGKKTVGNNSEDLVNRVDDLQDLVEELRKDVVTRGVRPLPSTLDAVTSDITTAAQNLKKMKDMVKKEKPVWSKIWEKELELVCNDREFLTLQEELIADLEDDLEKATQTFALVEQATKQQHSQQQTGPGVTLRSTSRGFGGVDPSLDPETARAGVMGEVRALQPNHESRLEAIERAEKARAKDLAGRKDGVFKQELTQFVESNKLQKTGGFEEIERKRLVLDGKNLQTTWSVEQEEKARRKKERAEKKAREAAERARIAAEEAQLEAQEGMGNDEGLVNEPPPEGDNGAMQHVGYEAQDAHHNGVEDDGQNQDGSRKSWLPSIFSGAA